MTTYTIRTRGLIPVIYKQGPMSGIELDAPILLDLVMRGVDIVDDSTGKVVQVADIIAKKSPKEKAWETAPKKEEIPQAIPQKPVITPPVKEEPKAAELEHAPAPIPESPALTPVVEEQGTDDPAADDSTEELEEEPVETDASATTATSEIPDKYAGMSRNQRKKAMKREAAARAAQQIGSETTETAQTVN